MGLIEGTGESFGTADEPERGVAETGVGVVFGRLSAESVPFVFAVALFEVKCGGCGG